MRFVTFSLNGVDVPGVVDRGRVTSLREAGCESVLSIIAGGAEALKRVREYAASVAASDTLELASVTLRPPIPRPPKIICIGLNYRDHAAEAKLEIPSVPTVFAKFPTAALAPGAPIVLPKNSRKPDYEAEFAFVVGRGGRYIAEADWRAHVFGYTCFNDVSARDYQTATSQWMIGKTFDAFAPFGPWIVTADEVEDPHSLDITMRLGDQVMQRSNTRELIFGIPQLIAHLSSVFTLEPGDIVATGTPSGVGFGQKPPRWLRAGDVCTVSISGIGDLVNPVEAEK